MAKDTFSSLRTKIDGREGFASGHQIIDTTTAAPGGHGHGAAQHIARMKKIPVWAFDNEKIREYVNKRFPKMETDVTQKKSAMRIVRLIHLYYRIGSTTAAIAGELGMSVKAVEMVLYRIRKQMDRELKPSHRPKKGEGIGTSYEGSKF